MPKETNQKPTIYSALEVANICGVVNQTAINWIRGGYLKAFNTPGGQYRVYADDLAHFMSERGMRIPENLSETTTININKTILIVDDDRGLNEVIKKYLLKQFPDFSILQSYDGFDAGTKIADKHPSVVILDIGLPNVNGFDICRKLKESDAFGYPYIIIVTVEEDPTIKEKLTAVGADMFLQKPLALLDLSNAVRVHLGMPVLR